MFLSEYFLAFINKTPFACRKRKTTAFRWWVADLSAFLIDIYHSIADFILKIYFHIILFYSYHKTLSSQNKTTHKKTKHNFTKIFSCTLFSFQITGMITIFY